MPPDAPRILVIRLSSMGDIILTTPVLAALKDHFPQAHVDVVVKGQYAQLLQNHPCVDGLFTLAPENNLLSLVRQLRGQGHDIVLDLHANLRSRLLMVSLPAHRKLRYHKKSLQRRLAILGRRHRDPWVHTVDMYLDCLRPLGIQAPRGRPKLSLNAQDELFAEDYLRRHKLPRPAPLVGLHPGARWSGKRWPAERFAQVGHQLFERRKTPALIFGGPGEETLATRVAEQIGASGVAVVGISLRQMMALMARCAVLLTNDSGPMHLATALGVPVVAIFGPTHPSLGFWPLGERDVVLSAHLDCSPCSLHGDRRCPQNWPCLNQISIHDVVRAAEGILEGRPMATKKEEKKSAPAAEKASNVAVFLDRDGTINREVHYLSSPEQLELLPGAGEAIRRLNELGLKVVVVTNQSGVARGFLNEEKLAEIHQLLGEMLAQRGARLDGIYYCPEMPDSGSRCRKPEIGMMEQAARDLHLDLKRCYVVGDMAKDIEMGRRAGSRTVLVLTGYGQGDREKVSPDFVAQTLAEAVDWIAQDLKGK